MYLVLLREFFRRGVVITFCVLLVACGGGGSGGEAVSDNPTGGQPPVLPPPVSETPVEMGLMVAFGYNSLVAGAPFKTNQVQSLAVGNGTANYRFPRSGESISGNITIAVDVADPDGIARVLVGFNGSEQALVLCEVNCGASFSQTVTGVNPRNFGLSPGSLRLELWLEDQLGNRILFDARDIEWLPEAVVGVNTSRTAGTLQVNWSANSSARRYNLYIAEQPGITPENILTKTGGRQFLALSQTGFSVPAVVDSQRYFVLITGVDASGESLYSEQHVIQPVGAPQFSLPVAAADQFNLNEDEELSGFLLANDSHPDARSFSLDSQVVRSPENGAVQLNADGSFVYKPAANFVGNDSFIYQITDTQGLTAQALVSLTVLPINDLPVALDDSYSLNKNTSLSIASPGLLANDLDLDGDSLIVDSIAVTNPAHGSVQLNPDGAFSYTPTENYTGEDFFVYQLTDGQGGVAQAKVTLLIEMTNAAPVAQNDSYQVGEDEELIVTAAAGLLANDTDPDGDTISLQPELLSTVQNGQLLLASDGSFQYLPDQDFFGTDSFSYQIADPAGLVSAATVVLNVLAQNDPPVVQAASFSVNHNTPLSVAAPGLLAYASDVDDQNLTLDGQVVVAPTKGSVQLSQDGSFSYSANSQETGSDSFVFRVLDGTGASSTGTVVINIIYQASAPVLADASYQLFANSPNGYAFAQLTAADSDPNDTVSFSIISGNDAGIFSLSTSGLFMVADATQLAQFSGTTKTLVVQAQDSYGLIDQAVLQIQIVAIPVIAQPDTYSLAQGSTLTATPGVLANDSESSSATLTASLISGPAHGQLTLSANGSFVYTPAPTFYGSDSFIYQASNGTYSAQAMVTLNVLSTPPSLQANFDAYTLDEDSTLTVTSADSLLLNDSFNPNEALTVSLVQAPPYGTLSLNTDGTFTYQPAANSYGAYYFTYRLTQGAITSDAQVELNISPVNDPPSLQDAAVTISDDYVNAQHVWTMTQYDADPGSYSYQILSGNSAGVFAITAGGTIQIANSSLLDAGTTASYSLVVQVTENGDASLVDTASVVITVIAAQTFETSVIADNSFASGGNLSLQMMLSGEYNNPTQVIPLSDGRSLVIGTVGPAASSKIFVARLTADGGIDTSYADRGLFKNKILIDSLSEQSVAAVVTSSNELVVLVNYVDSLGSGFFLFKLSETGVLDGSFGSGMGNIVCAANECGGHAEATDLLLNNLGHYVVSGSRDGTNAFVLEYADSGYQAGWISTLSSMEQFDLVRQDSDHNYYVVGQSSTASIIVARFSSSFSLDTTAFGCDTNLPPVCSGYREYNFSFAEAKAYDAVLYNDELYVVGSVTESSAPTSPDGLVFKLTYDGSLDPTFGTSSGFTQVYGNAGNPLHYKSVASDATGLYILTSTDGVNDDLISVSYYDWTGQFIQDQPLAADGQLKALDLQSDGVAIWVLQQFSNPNYGAVGSVSFNWIGKYQLTTLLADTSFSADGQRWFNAGFSSDTVQGSRRLVLGSQVNKTLFYGYSYSYVNGNYQQAFVGRLTSSGALDQSFGNHGLVLLADDQLAEMEVNTVLEAGSNQLYVAGSGLDTNNDQIGFVARLDQDGSVDQGFAGGIVDLIPAQLGSYNGSAAVHLQLKADGHLIVGAEYRQFQDNSDIALLQLNTDGSLDAGNFGSSAAGFTLFTEIDTNAQTEERLSQMKLDPADDTLVIAGQYKLMADPRLYVARFNETGLLMNTANSPSDTFGDAAQGYSVINLVDNSNDQTKYSEYLNALDFDAGQNLIFALSKNYEGDESHYLYRLQRNGLSDTSFNSGSPRLYNSFSDQTPVDLEIKAIHTDAEGRLLMVGTYGVNAWVGRVLLDGSGSNVGRWDPAFEANSATPGAYLFTGFTFSSDLFMQLTSSKVTLGWSNYDASGYSATLRQYQLYEYDPNFI
ncbi:Ig-like domain-containing protein [Rheinheimera faecalis]|uniref:Ig-like domain-containing protein n=1 Tax=Rheinheimera faecalis TaxID=2901141 RepID=UPI001E329861|nr:Ig-like domain-containing protein [Rheinheimera faecalis]